MRTALAILLLCAACSSSDGHKPVAQPEPPQMTPEECAAERALFFGNGSIAEISPDL